MMTDDDHIDGDKEADPEALGVLDEEEPALDLGEEEEAL